jgi:methyltransferase-like protein
LRDLVRHMMRFHNHQFSDAKEKIKQARALVKFASQAKVKPGLWQNILAQQFDRIGRYTDSGFFHDDLGEINQPFYFHEFREAADRHGLQYLSEADLPDMLADGFTDEAGAMLRQLESRDVVAREQYLDFLKGRAFRQTLVCRKGLEIDRDLNPHRITDLWVAGEIRPGQAPAEAKTPDAQEFHGPKGAVIATNNPVVKAALKELGGAFPGRILFPDLLVRARQGAGMTDQRDESVAADRKVLAEFLSRAHAIGFVDLHSSPPAFVTSVSERPRASRLARAQLELSDVIATRRHLTYRVEGVLARALLRCLDGTHDRAALLEKLTQVVGNQNNPLPEREAALRDLPRQLEEQLQGLAKAGLLEA